MTDKRTPEQIIGKDALLQLIFEGYAVVPVEPTLEQCGGDPALTELYKAMIKVEFGDGSAQYSYLAKV